MIDSFAEVVEVVLNSTLSPGLNYLALEEGDRELVVFHVPYSLLAVIVGPDQEE